MGGGKRERLFSLGRETNSKENTKKKPFFLPSLLNMEIAQYKF